MSEYQTPVDVEVPVSHETKAEKKPQNIAAKLVTIALGAIAALNIVGGKDANTSGNPDDGQIPPGQPTETATYEAIPVPEAVTAVSQDVLNAEHAAVRDRVIATQVAQDAMTAEAAQTPEAPSNE